MTSNQINAHANEIKKDELREKKRHNRRQEQLDYEGQKIQKRQGEYKMAADILGTMTKFAKANDKSWYNENAQLVKDVASISFNNPLGQTFPTMFNKYTNGRTAKAGAPGIMVLRFMPTVGALSKNGTASTADIAAKSLYSYVRYANSGSRNYESTDLMMYLLAVTEGYSYYAYLTRLYSLLTTCKSENRYYVDGMIKAVGADPKDLRLHIADLRSYINSLAVRLNSLYIPKDLPYMQRHVWMNTSIFKDAPVKKSQEYLFLQKDFLKYDDFAGKLTVFPATVEESSYGDYAYDFKPNAQFTYNQLVNTGDLIINSLIHSEDAGIMGGDILKAYGEGNMAYASIIPEDYHIESAYHYEVLTQIHNAMFSGMPTTGFSDSDRLHLFDIYQTSINQVDFLAQGKPYYNSNDDAISGTNAIGFGIPATLGLTQEHVISYGVNTDNTIVNFEQDVVTPDDVMVATRLQFVADGEHFFTMGDGQASIQCGCINDMGSEIAIDYSTITLGDSPSTFEIYSGLATIIDLNSLPGVINRVATICNFDWHPRFIVLGADTRTAALGFSDLANYTTISDQTKQNLNYVALLSEFGISKLGLTVRTRS